MLQFAVAEVEVEYPWINLIISWMKMNLHSSPKSMGAVCKKYGRIYEGDLYIPYVLNYAVRKYSITRVLQPTTRLDGVKFSPKKLSKNSENPI